MSHATSSGDNGRHFPPSSTIVLKPIAQIMTFCLSVRFRINLNPSSCESYMVKTCKALCSRHGAQSEGSSHDPNYQSTAMDNIDT